MPVAANTLPDYFEDISPTKAIFGKYLKERCLSELYLQLFFNLFVLTQSSQNRPDKFGNILLRKAFSGKHLKEEYLSEAKLQLSFKYFVSFRIVIKLFSKVRK